MILRLGLLPPYLAPEAHRLFVMEPLTTDLTLESLFSEQVTLTELIGDNLSAAEEVKKCRFLEGIPGEIRNRIYEYALTGNNGEATLQFGVLVPPTLPPREQRREKKAAKLMRLQQHNETLSRLKSEHRSRQIDFDEEKARIEELEEDIREIDRESRYKTDKTRALDGMRIRLASLEGNVSRITSTIEIKDRSRKSLLHPEEASTHIKGPSSIYIEDENVKKAVHSFRDIDNMFALSRTCKQMHQECSALVYEYNKIRFVMRNVVKGSFFDENFFDQDLKHIVQQQTKYNKLNRVIIDLGGLESSLGGTRTLKAHMRKNQESLRKLHKSCKSLTLQYESEIRQVGLRSKHKLAFKLLLDHPESVLSQFNETLTSLTMLGWDDVRSMRECLLTVFWPAWALRNASKICAETSLLDTPIPSIDIAALRIHQDEALAEETTNPALPNAANMRDAAKPCLFLDKIPGEIRNRIYEFALVGEDGEAVLKYCILNPTSPAFTEEEHQEAKREKLRAITHSVQIATRQLEGNRAELEVIDWRIETLEETLEAYTEESVTRSDATYDLRSLRSRRSDAGRAMSRLRSSIADDERLKQRILSGEVRVEPELPRLNAHEIPLAVDDGQIKQKREAFRDENNIFALARTCKQIHEECSGLVYEYNKIKFVTMPFSSRKSSTDLQLKHIVARQSESGELQQGLIIDVGEVRETADRELELFIDANQHSLRTLRKSSKSLALHFQLQDVRWNQHQSRLYHEPVVCRLSIDSPESVVSQVDALLAAESQRLHAERLAFIKTKLVKTFWPLWAVRNFL
ncbi:uncharacterized protein MYCFIDRAFT_199077 [Pseudocercospora fijiensis CIRAD86]|uniref:F-box domain-containing protein n=1 Tax=Pseudocercospora fijiensis (strain CIRAD86) TaxID=383855 RepID=M3AQA3_PSEFD|nr:uncharacterized protein MYCFIDRAFT_199077 [Pseudocercospora fijiensis CIRAD86]EME79258.1 hypothetical protein MYCFIDRAFT_199077 [Pseudocercospora fijiensis CIRAD86]